MKGKPNKAHINNNMAQTIKSIYEDKRFNSDNFRVRDFRDKGIALNRTLQRLEEGRLTLNGAASFLDVMGYELKVEIIKK